MSNSPNFSLFKNYGTDKKNLFDIWELCKLVIISYNLMTFTFDPGVILRGEVRSQSPSGVKGLKALFSFDRNESDLG